MMRIITGKARGVKLLTLEGENTRPTSERAKEAVFSMLAFDIEGREVLDLYAGSGQMGLEALSRGAMRTTFIDNSSAAVDIIKKNIIKTKLIDGAVCLKSDVNDFLKRARGQFDIVFIDPPYALRAVSSALEIMVERKLLKPSSIVVCESEEENIFENNPTLEKYFTVKRRAKYGMAHITVLEMAEVEA